MRVRVRDFDVHYEEAGEGRPIVILHGGVVGNGRMAMHEFEPFFAGRRGWRRIYPDAIGHGRTPMPPDTFGHDAVVDILLETIDVLAPGARLVLAGWSWGGYLARGIVRKRLPMLDGVMLNAPLFGPGQTLPPRAVIHTESGFEAAVPPDDAWVADMLTVRTARTLEAALAGVARLAEPAPGAGEPIDRSYLSDDLDTLPEPCLAPTLVVLGRQDTVVGYRDQLRFMENYPRGTFAVLDGAGHLLSAEHPVLFAALTNDWLDRVERHVGMA